MNKVWQPASLEVKPPVFIPTVVRYSEWLSGSPSHDGERILWSDGTARGMPEHDTEFVTVLRRSDGLV